MKVMIYVQHLMGIGHQKRASAIARAMAAKGLDVHYVSGGFRNRLFPLVDEIEKRRIGGFTGRQLNEIRIPDVQMRHWKSGEI